jgi:hypothetical protein
VPEILGQDGGASGDPRGPARARGRRSGNG